MADKMRFYPDKRDRSIYVPSVTTVCAILAKPGLVNWKMEQAILAATDDLANYTQAQFTGLSPDGPNVFVALPDFLYGNMSRWIAVANDAARAAADLGTEVHARLERMHRGLEFDMTEDQLATKLVSPYVDWYTKSVSKPLLVERVVYGMGTGGLPYAGTLDLCAALGPKPIIYQTAKRHKEGVEGEWAVIDIKTSNNFYPEYGMQLAAYAATATATLAGHAAGFAGGPRLLSVRLDKETHLAYVKEWSFVRYWSMFDAALTLWYELNPTAVENYGKRMAKLVEQPHFESEQSVMQFSNVGEDDEFEFDWDDPVDDVL